jgi:PilZ domain
MRAYATEIASLHLSPKGESPMKTEHRLTPRYPFSAMAEIVDEAENARTSSRVSDLSLNGCYVEMNNPFPEGTNVMIEISTETESLETHAIVAHIEPKRGMGLTFGEMPKSLANVLNRWLVQARENKPN